MSGNQRQTVNGAVYSCCHFLVLLFIIYSDIGIIDASTSNNHQLITAKEVAIIETSRGSNSDKLINDVVFDDKNNSNNTSDVSGNDGNFDKQETAGSMKVPDTNGSKQVLSRRRRYLSFPSGSSFQVVYDQTLPIIALIDIFTIGVTVAIAWPLPDEPLYKIHEQLLDKYKDIEKERIDQIKQEIMQDRIDKLANDTQKPSKYSNQTLTMLSNNKLKPSQINKIFLSPLQWDKNDWATVIKKIASIRKNSQPLKATQQRRYYPVFGKRSIPTRYLNHEDMFYAHHHRESRQTLYSKITQFLNARGLDGISCVLRALCETGQRANDHKPGTFLQEIMRAIFTLPEAVLEEEGILPHHRKYDEAHSEEKNCTEKYPACSHSIWDKNFWF